MVKPRALSWTVDDDGALTALNPYEGEPESADYASRYVVRGDERTGYVVAGEYAGAESPIGSFDDVEDAKAAAQGDADERAGVEDDPA